MSKKNNTAAAKKAAAELQGKLQEAKVDLAKAQEVLAAAQNDFDAADEAGKEPAKVILDAASVDLEKAEAAVEALEGKKVLVRALLPLSGRFMLPYDPDHEFECDPLQAQEIVDTRYGEYVK